MSNNIFENNGLVTKSSFESTEWCKIFELMEVEQQKFLSKEKYFRNSNYIWPNDALHNWSRIWEYPYSFYTINKFLKTYQKTESPKALDFGSGLTFFPFVVNDLGYEVYCADTDISLALQIKNACNALDLSNESIKFLLSKDNKIDIEDNYFDVIYSISVLEHIPASQFIISELYRLLKPNGLLILTIDLDMMGNAQIDLPSYFKLKNEIRKFFDDFYLNKLVHPVDILYSNEGKYRLELSSKYFIKRVYLSAMKIFNKNKYNRKLACECNVLIKREK